MTTDTTPTTDVDRPAAPSVLHPVTGELVPVVADTPTDVLADVRDRLVEHRRDVDATCRILDAEVSRRLDYEGARSASIAGGAGRFKVTVAAPTKTEWDAPALYRALRRLVRDGLISKDRADAACRRVTDYKHAHGSAAALLKHADERVRDAVAACRRDVPVDNRRVSVTRQHGGAA
jgi:hypothetical protein